MEIKTQRLVIRETSSADMKEFRETCNDTTSVTDYLTNLSDAELSVAFQDVAGLSAFFSRLTNSVGDGNEAIYGAYMVDDLIGYIAIVESEIPDLQIALAPSFRSQGYGFEFLYALLKYLFAEKQYEVIRYTVLPTNKASIKLVEKVGATLQPPKSNAEKLFIRTYHISKESLTAQSSCIKKE